MKRAFDIFASFFGLIVLSPLFIIVSILIMIDSRGGVFYRQTRVGRYGKDFRLYKFRSMRTDSDKKGLITIGGRDSRITRIGYYLRKYKIDELPQLINVLIGDMSFVGPRPEVRRYVDLYTTNQLKVLDVRPGITDVASIKYRNENEILGTVENPDDYYINTIMPDKLALNLDYLNRRTFLSDIQVIIRTVIPIEDVAN